MPSVIQWPLHRRTVHAVQRVNPQANTRTRAARILARQHPGSPFTQRNRWYNLTSYTDGPAVLQIFDEIGLYGITAADLVGQLAQLDADSIDLQINSPGGEVFDGIAIMNALRQHKARVTANVYSVAASIASVIAMAGDEIVMMPSSQLMIHDGMGLCVGDAADMREMADLLDRQSDNIAGIYTERAGGRRDTWRKRMREETWYSAEEAVAAGLADRVAEMPKRRRHGDDEQTPMFAQVDLSAFRYQGRDEAPAPDVPTVANTAVGPHDTATVEGTWDGGAAERALPSPMTVATARAVYTWYDAERVEDGEIAKAYCKLPHHEVSADGEPGAANMNGVRNALARLPQTDGLSDAERATAERHLRAHLEAGGGGEDTSENRAGVQLTDWTPDVFRTAMARATGELVDWDPELFKNAVTVQAEDAPAVVRRPDPPPDPSSLGWRDPDPVDLPEPISAADVFKAAVGYEAGHAPAAPARPPDPETEDVHDPTVFTHALREATRE